MLKLKPTSHVVVGGTVSHEPHALPQLSVAMSSRFIRFFILALLLLLIPSFIYLSHTRVSLVRDPQTGEWMVGGAMQSKQGYEPAWIKGPATTPFFDMGGLGKIIKSIPNPTFSVAEQPSPLSPIQPVVERPVDGVYAPEMTNATAKYVE